MGELSNPLPVGAIEVLLVTSWPLVIGRQLLLEYGETTIKVVAARWLALSGGAGNKKTKRSLN